MKVKNLRHVVLRCGPGDLAKPGSKIYLVLIDPVNEWQFEIKVTMGQLNSRIGKPADVVSRYIAQVENDGNQSIYLDFVKPKKGNRANMFATLA